MTFPGFTASLLRASADGFAGLAAGRLFERAGLDLGDGFATWRERLRTQLLELAIAVEDGTPERFARHLAWAREGLAAHGSGAAELTAGLEELGEVLRTSLPKAAWTPLPPYLERAAEELAGAPGPADAELSANDPSQRLALEFVDLLRAGEVRAAAARILEAVEAGTIDVATALESVLAPALREIGRLWHQNQADVGEEHLVSAATGRVLARLLARVAAAPADAPTVLVASVAGDRHGLGVQIAAACFELAGWRTLFLGCDLPPVALARAAQRFDADLVALGATLETQREAVADAIRALRAARPGLKVLVGGPAFAGQPPTWQRVGADAHAPSAREAVRVGAELLGR